MKPLLTISLLLFTLHSSAQDTTKKTIYSDVEIEAAYPGGQAAWLRFLNKNLRIPSNAKADELAGTVVIEFIVDDKGNIRDVHAISGPEALKQEAERVLRRSKPWTPAILHGQKVCSRKTIPIIIN
jgi:periplasmic protein TonB